MRVRSGYTYFVSEYTWIVPPEFIRMYIYEDNKIKNVESNAICVHCFCRFIEVSQYPKYIPGLVSLNIHPFTTIS
jgi:hypothetical protein